jgi:DNA-binding MurR/RpiR family transcriptional regulator
MRARIAKPQDGDKEKPAGTPLEVRFAQAQLSRNRRELIRAILDNHEQAYFLSSRELAKRYNVDAATVVRAIQDLGYERFADFAADLREHFVRQITP